MDDQPKLTPSVSITPDGSVSDPNALIDYNNEKYRQRAHIGVRVDRNPQNNGPVDPARQEQTDLNVGINPHTNEIEIHPPMGDTRRILGTEVHHGQVGNPRERKVRVSIKEGDNKWENYVLRLVQQGIPDIVVDPTLPIEQQPEEVQKVFEGVSVMVTPPGDPPAIEESEITPASALITPLSTLPPRELRRTPSEPPVKEEEKKRKRRENYCLPSCLT